MEANNSESDWPPTHNTETSKSWDTLVAIREGVRLFNSPLHREHVRLLYSYGQNVPIFRAVMVADEP
jgi:hypothetical protein